MRLLQSIVVTERYGLYSSDGRAILSGRDLTFMESQVSTSPLEPIETVEPSASPAPMVIFTICFLRRLLGEFVLIQDNSWLRIKDHVHGSSCCIWTYPVSQYSSLLFGGCFLRLLLLN